jgi:hypothetical protein
MPDTSPSIDTRPTGQPPVFVPGEYVSAGKLNRVVELALGNAMGVNPPRLRRGVTQADPRVYPMRVINEDGDFLVCVPADENVGNALPSYGSVRVAKPYLLRRTPFDGKSRAGITYYYDSAYQRRAYDEDNHTETQIIVPPYVAGDTIYTTRSVVGGIAITPAGQPQGITEFLDLNVAGRYWGAS